MAGQKKNDIGCFGAIVYLVLFIFGIVMLISVIGGILAVIAVAIVIAFSIKLLYRLSKKICIAIYKKYIKRKSYEELTFEIEEADSSLEYNEIEQKKLSEPLPGKLQKEQKKTERKGKNTRAEKPKRKMSAYDLEQFAIMCNAGMEREDEMKQYEESEIQDN